MQDKTGKELSSKEVVSKGKNRIKSLLIEAKVFGLHTIGAYVLVEVLLYIWAQDFIILQILT